MEENSIYGCLFFDMKTYFVHNDCGFLLQRDIDKSILDDESVLEIKNKLIERKNYIISKINIKNINIEPKLNKTITKKRRQGGNYNYFILPPQNNCEKSIEYFNTNLSKIDRGYLSATTDPDNVKAIFLHFFNISDFNMNKLIERESSTIEELYINEESVKKIEKLKILVKESKGIILSEQANFEKKEIIKNLILLNTVNDVNDPFFYPVYVDAEYIYNSKTKSITRQLYLSDGNHRILSLIANGYNGLVPTIICDYLPYII